MRACRPSSLVRFIRAVCVRWTKSCVFLIQRLAVFPFCPGSVSWLLRLICCLPSWSSVCGCLCGCGVSRPHRWSAKNRQYCSDCAPVSPPADSREDWYTLRWVCRRVVGFLKKRSCCLERLATTEAGVFYSTRVCCVCLSKSPAPLMA